MSRGLSLPHVCRIEWICVAAAASCLAGGVAKGQADPSQWTEAKRRRVAAVEARPWRVIFNDDSEALAHPGADDPDVFMSVRLRPLAESGVSTVSLSVLGNWGDAPSYDSKVQPIHGDASGGPPPGYKAYAHNLKALITAGRCPLQTATDFAHENDIELFASVRMNDVHDSFIDGLITTWKRENPQLLVNAQGRNDNKSLYVTAQDYTHEPVRQRKLEVIEEIAGRYDVDGLALDFIRHPVFFSPTMRDEPVTAEQIAIMTSLMGRIRAIADAAAAKRGRPMLIAARIGDTIDLSRRIGLDVQAWLEQDLVDMLIVGGGYAPDSLALTDVVTAAGPYAVAVLPCDNSVRETTTLRRAFVSRWHHLGAGGVYYWNLSLPFTHPTKLTGDKLAAVRVGSYAILHEAVDPANLVHLDKLYETDGEVFRYYAHASSRPALPMQVMRGHTAEHTIVIGDDVEAATAAGKFKEAALTFRLAGAVTGEYFAVTLNGTPLNNRQVTETNEQHTWIRFALTAPPLRLGANVVQISLDEAAGAEAVVIQRTKLNINYSP